MPKRDPGLRNFARNPRQSRIAGWSLGRAPSSVTRASDALRRATDGSASTGVERVNVLIELYEGTVDVPADLEALGFEVHTRAGQVVSGTIPREVNDALEQIAGIKRVELSRPLKHELELAIPAINADIVSNGTRKLRGAGVVIGIIDSGIDFRHESFQRSGRSRILAIWDQALTAVDGEHAPAPFNYGVEYTREAISAAINPSASAQVRASVRHTNEAPFHGTLVAGAAAGSGHPTNLPICNGQVRFVGVAPEADLVVVATTRGERSNPGSFGDSADTLDAVKYILDVAGGRPVAINLSLGDNIGPHDGTSLLEVGIANLINSGPGQALIKSAGNEADQRHHGAGELADGDPNDVEIQIAFAVDEVTLDLWYPKDNRIALTIIPPGAAAPTPTVSPPFEARVPLANGNVATILSDLDDPGNHDNRIHVILESGTRTEGVEPGAWTFRLTGTGHWDAWIQRNSPAMFTAPFVSSASTISIPGTHDAIISVGAFNISHSTRKGMLSPFSGRGPTRDNRQAPTLTAPGEKLWSAMPAPCFFGTYAGTSMSAPLVTGAAALMLEINPRLTVAQIKRCLERSADPDPQTNAPSNEWGFGKLDVARACRHARSIV